MSSGYAYRGSAAVDPLLRAVQTTETDESLNSRLAGATEAQKRSRFLLVIIGVACAAMCVAAYNACWSFDTEFTLESVAADPSTLNTPASNRIDPRDFTPRTGPTILREHAIRSWADNRFVSISLLGIRVSVDDAPIVGTFALVVISIWRLLAIRREHITIASLLRDTRRNGDVTVDLLRRQWRVFHGIVSESVFTTFEKSLTPISGLRIHHKTDGGRPKVVWRVLTVIMHFGWTKRVGLQRLVLNTFVQFVFWLPVLTSLFVFILDRLTYYQRSPFRDGIINPASGGNAVELFPLWRWWFWGCFFVLFFVTLLSFAYNRCTETTIREYHGELKNSLRLLDANDEIRRLAYQRWQEAGCPDCNGARFWLDAEREVFQVRRL
jgi:Protein of unknown function (DUF2934)